MLENVKHVEMNIRTWARIDVKYQSYPNRIRLISKAYGGINMKLDEYITENIQKRAKYNKKLPHVIKGRIFIPGDNILGFDEI